jgi:hypothetical protein
MKPLSDPQELARRFNEDEAVWRRFEQKRSFRDSASSRPEELLDETDWQEAERECRQTRCVGKPLNRAKP